MKHRRSSWAIVISAACGFVLCACDARPKEAARPVVPERLRPTLILSQAQFDKYRDEQTGGSGMKPGAARLVLIQRSGEGWQRSVIEDPESNAFHKAVVWADPTDHTGVPGILTIGASKALLKFWQRYPDGWRARTLWEGHFGGKIDRLRDFELGDVTGDGRENIVIGTHDQGVVVVLELKGGTWQATEIDRKPDTFVHEIELGDLDGDGRLEIYATPSRPNRFDGVTQPGEIAAYWRTEDGGFERRVVASYPARHAKEILATDLGGGPVLLAAVEGELTEGKDIPREEQAERIVSYRWDGTSYVGETLCTLPDQMCRFLSVADVDGDGQREIVASTYRSGLWVIRHSGDGWEPVSIDTLSQGFEHPLVLADFNRDGVPGIFVVSERQLEVRRYWWAEGAFRVERIQQLEPGRITFHIGAGRL